MRTRLVIGKFGGLAILYKRITSEVFTPQGIAIESIISGLVFNVIKTWLGLERTLLTV